jgi:hypothetical protein
MAENTPKKPKKPAKKRAKKYEPKLKVDGSFIDVIKAALSPDNKKTDEG